MKKIIVRKSFLSNLLGEGIYEEAKPISIIIVLAGTIIIGLSVLLSCFFHNLLINYFISNFLGTNLLFVVYVVFWIVLLNYQVEVEDEIPESYYEKNYRQATNNKPLKYKLTILYFFALVILGVTTIYYTNLYRKKYEFECTEFLVDKELKIYHIKESYEDDDSECEGKNYKFDLDFEDEKEELLYYFTYQAKQYSKLETLKGYQIDKNFRICNYCKGWAEAMDDYYDIGRTGHVQIH